MATWSPEPPCRRIKPTLWPRPEPKCLTWTTNHCAAPTPPTSTMTRGRWWDAHVHDVHVHIQFQHYEYLNFFLSSPVYGGVAAPAGTASATPLAWRGVANQESTSRYYQAKTRTVLKTTNQRRKGPAGRAAWVEFHILSRSICQNSYKSRPCHTPTENATVDWTDPFLPLRTPRNEKRHTDLPSRMRTLRRFILTFICFSRTCHAHKTYWGLFCVVWKVETFRRRLDS